MHLRSRRPARRAGGSGLLAVGRIPLCLVPSAVMFTVSSHPRCPVVVRVLTVMAAICVALDGGEADFLAVHGFYIVAWLVDTGDAAVIARAEAGTVSIVFRESRAGQGAGRGLGIGLGI